MKEEVRKDIEDSALFVSIVPVGGIEGTPGEDSLRYAMSLHKKIIIWRPNPTNLRPIPVILKQAGYEDCLDITGGDHELTKTLRAICGDNIEFKEEGWSKNYAS